MSALRITALAMLAIMLSGCGQLVSEKLAASTASTQQRCTSKKMVILPFADYSYEEDATRAFQRNINIMENLTARLTEKGFNLPIEEDLLQYLSDNNIIETNSNLAQGQASPGSLEYSLTNDQSWSPLMKLELAKVLAESQGQNNNRQQTNNYALDEKTLAKIAGRFNADFIMRGRLIKYEFGEENTWSPIKRGIMPVLFTGTNRAIFGVTNSDEYDGLGSAAVGGVAGAIIGYDASGPYDLTEKLNPGRFNSLVWGLGGAALGYMSSKGGHANQVAVQLRLWVQDPDSAEVIWTNSIEVKVKPQSVFAENREDKLFDTAVSQAVAALMEDFVNKTKTAL